MYRVKLVAEVNQTPEEEEVVPHVVQLISPPFLGRTVLTAGPAKFGMDLTKQEHGVSFQCDSHMVYNVKINSTMTNRFFTKLCKCYLFCLTYTSLLSPAI